MLGGDRVVGNERAVMRWCPEREGVIVNTYSTRCGLIGGNVSDVA